MTVRQKFNVFIFLYYRADRHLQKSMMLEKVTWLNNATC